MAAANVRAVGFAERSTALSEPHIELDLTHIRDSRVLDSTVL